jgi:hypothetical protein
MLTRIIFPDLWFGVPFPPMKIPKIPKKSPRIVDFGLFLHRHSKPLGIWTNDPLNFFVSTPLTHCRNFINIWASIKK